MTAPISDKLVEAVATMPPSLLGEFVPAFTRCASRDLRDELIRRYAVRYVQFEARTKAAKIIAADLAGGGDIAATQFEHLTRILFLNGGQSPGWRQISDILDGWRGR